MEKVRSDVSRSRIYNIKKRPKGQLIRFCCNEIKNEMMNQFVVQ